MFTVCCREETFVHTISSPAEALAAIDATLPATAARPTVARIALRSNPRNLLMRWWGQPDLAFGPGLRGKWACPDYPRGSVVEIALEPDANGERQIWLAADVVNRLRSLRGTGESYSDVILRLAAAQGS
jgi:hypothetical protein